MSVTPTFKAFVSSTFDDLKDHRAHVIARLRRCGIHVDPMEDWTATGDEPKQFSQDRVQGCHVCILLVAFRRGFVPPSEALSITQMEYQAALELGIAVLPFLLHEDANWPSSWDQRHSDPEINRWRQEIGLKHGVELFSEDPTSVDVAPAVFRWMLKQHASAAAGQIGPSKLKLRPEHFLSYLEEKRRRFVGRDWLFAKIEDWHSQRPEKALLIIGDPGIGKSTIVAELVHRQLGKQVLAYHCCRHDVPTTLDPGKLVRNVAAMLASHLPGYAEQLQDEAVQEALSEATCQTEPLRAFEQGVLGPLGKLPEPEEGHYYLLIDALDESLVERSDVTIVQMLAARLNLFPSWLRLLATTRNELDVLERLRGLRAWTLAADDPGNQLDVTLYLQRRLTQQLLSDLLAESSTSVEEVSRTILERAAGNFLYVEQTLDGLESGLYCADELDSLPPGLDGHYLRFFERHFPELEAYRQGPRKLLQVIVAALEPLTEEQFAAATELDLDDELMPLLKRLASFVPERLGEDGVPRYALYHKSFADWLTRDRKATFYANPQKGHERLAGLCWHEWQKQGRNLSGYALKHLRAHLLQAQRWEDVVALLTDLAYLEAKAEAGMVFELVMDFTRAVQVLPREHLWHRNLALIEEALRQDLHFLNWQPTTLFQCLWNRCWWYDSTEAEKHYEIPEERRVSGDLPWHRPEPRLYTLLERWRQQKEQRQPGFVWLRSLRPPVTHLATALKMTFRGHQGDVNSVSFSADGSRIASGSSDKTVRLWDADSGVELLCLQGHQHWVSSVSFSGDSRRIASGSSDKTVRQWDADSDAELLHLRGHQDDVSSVSFSADGRCIASGSSDKTVRLWNTESGAELLCLQGHQGYVVSVSISEDGRRIVSGSSDNTVRLWDGESGAELFCFQGHQGPVSSVSFSADSRRVASGSSDNTVRLWDAESGAELLCLQGHQRHVESVSISEDGRRIASGSSDNTVRLWDAETGVEQFCLHGHQGAVRSVGFSADGRCIVSASHEQTVGMYDAESGALLSCLTGKHGVSSLSFSTAIGGIFRVSNDQTVRLWDAETGECLQVHEGTSHIRPFLQAYETSLHMRLEPLGMAVLSQANSPLAWWPVMLQDCHCNASGRLWTGYEGSYVAILRLEGKLPRL